MHAFLGSARLTASSLERCTVSVVMSRSLTTSTHCGRISLGCSAARRNASRDMLLSGSRIRYMSWSIIWRLSHVAWEHCPSDARDDCRSLNSIRIVRRRPRRAKRATPHLVLGRCEVENPIEGIEDVVRQSDAVSECPFLTDSWCQPSYFLASCSEQPTR
jgi:hypothetical protein